jgi:DNA-binding transcriptional LysR family regulator
MLHARILTYLDEVARSGSIRKAAARLNVASTAINRQIIALEEEIGQRLFDRIPRRLRLTAAGEVLIEHVRDTLKAFERTKARLDALKGARHGQILLATTVGFAGGPMPKIVYDFGRKHPNVRILVRGMFTDAIPNAILSGDFSLGLAFNLDPNPGLRTLLKFEIPFGAVVAPSHPLANRSRVRCATDGCMINNPHDFKLEDGGRFDPDGRKMAFRKSVDPHGLLNPGKIRNQ